MCGDRIKLIDKVNKHAVCPSCDELETWDHVVLCDKMKDERDAWVKKIEKSFIDVSNKLNASMCEINIVKEMIKDGVKKSIKR